MRDRHFDKEDGSSKVTPYFHASCEDFLPIILTRNTINQLYLFQQLCIYLFITINMAALKVESSPPPPLPPLMAFFLACSAAARPSVGRGILFFVGCLLLLL